MSVAMLVGWRVSVWRLHDYDMLRLHSLAEFAGEMLRRDTGAEPQPNIQLMSSRDKSTQWTLLFGGVLLPKSV